MPEETESPFVKTAPPVIRPVDGVAMQGDYPLNSRLRAEALAAAGVDRDPEALVTAELIADAKERMANLTKAAADAQTRVDAANADIAEGKTLDEDAASQLIADRMSIELAERSSGEAPPELSEMSKAALEETALREGVDLAGARTNADRVALIEAARAGTATSSDAGTAGASGPEA
jgi:hypothetical protein